MTVTKETPIACLTVGQFTDLIADVIKPQTSSNESSTTWPEIFGTREFCRLTGYSPNTLYKLLHDRKIPYHKSGHGGRKVIFKREEIQEWILSNRIETSSEYCTRKNEYLEERRHK